MIVTTLRHTRPFTNFPPKNQIKAQLGMGPLPDGGSQPSCE